MEPTREIQVKFNRFREVESFLKEKREKIDSQIFVSETPDGILMPSKLYEFDGFLTNLKDAATKGIAGQFFYVGEDNRGSLSHGLVNIALFLAHSMTRGILWDTCEEVNNEMIDGKIPFSNACGKNGKSYADQGCRMNEVTMECPVDPTMTVDQASVGNSGFPPFFCAPTSTKPFTGYYNPLSNETVSNAPFANAFGRQDVEGKIDIDVLCCNQREMLLYFYI